MCYRILFLLAGGFFLWLFPGCSSKETDPTPIDQSKYVWICGWEDSTGYATILKSDDAGLNWKRQGENQDALKGITLNDIWAVDEDIVWAVGNHNSIVRTLNGGVGWTRADIVLIPSSAEFLAISMPDRNSIWISGGNGTVLHSPDAGAMWIHFNSTTLDSAQLQGIWAVNNQKVFVVGGIDEGGDNVSGFVAFTVDGGNSWERMVAPMDYNKWEWIGVTASGENMVIYGGESHYMVSYDQGESWHPDSIQGMGGGDRHADINHLIMLSPEIWWAACDEGHIAFTSDAGTTWTIQQTNKGGYFLVGIDAWNSQLALATGISESLSRNIPVLRTTNGGITWDVVLQIDCNLNKVSFTKN